MPANVTTKATRKALPKPEILATPLETNAVENCVLRAAGVTADTEGPYTGRRYMLAGTVLAKREDGTYEEYEATGHKDAVDEVQEIQVKATKGNFKIAFDGETTGNIKFNASAAEVQAALEALSNVDPGDIVVTGGPGDATGTTPYVLTFGGQYAGTNVPAVTTDESGLEEGTKKATVTTKTAGHPEEEGSQEIAGILFETVEFADATSGSNEAAAFLDWNTNFDLNKIVNFEDLKQELLEWASENNCKFTDAEQANV